MGKLNNKQLKFLNLILDGVPNNEAYMQVYKVKNLNTAGANASETLRNPKCVEYLAEQRAILEATAVMSREYKRKKLKEVVDGPESQNALISAIKVDNEMVGHNAPIKTEVTTNQDTINVIVQDSAEAKEIKEMLNK